jgi:hypothetical protein
MSTNKNDTQFHYETSNNIQCAECGQFISFKDIESGAAKYYFVADTWCTPEESFYICKKCRD